MKDVILNPEFLAYKFNFDTESVEFIKISDAEIRQVTWLKHQSIDPQRQLVAVPLTAVCDALEASAQVAPRVDYIFHTAYCASTFLSRCVDVPGVTLSLREPQLLLDAANAKRLQWQSRVAAYNYQTLIEVALKLFQKHCANSERLVIKPINSVNNIVAELLAHNSRSKALMLYTDARNFTLSALRKGESARQTIRAMFDLLRCDFPHLSKLRLSDAIHMSDLKLILTFWRLQIEQAEQTWVQLPSSDSLGSIYAERLINSPRTALIAVDRFFDLALGEEKISEIANSEVARTDAKNPSQQFSIEARTASYEKLQLFFGADLENGLAWLSNNNAGTKLKPSLPKPLVF